MTRKGTKSQASLLLDGERAVRILQPAPPPLPPPPPPPLLLLLLQMAHRSRAIHT